MKQITAREILKEGIGCCLKTPAGFDLDQRVKIIAGGQNDYSKGFEANEGIKTCGTESGSFCIFKTKDGVVWVFDESEDYTGHGCQCGSDLKPYANVKEAIRLGISESMVAALPKRLAKMRDDER